MIIGKPCGYVAQEPTQYRHAAFLIANASFSSPPTVISPIHRVPSPLVKVSSKANPASLPPARSHHKRGYVYRSPPVPTILLDDKGNEGLGRPAYGDMYPGVLRL